MRRVWHFGRRLELRARIGMRPRRGSATMILRSASPIAMRKVIQPAGSSQLPPLPLLNSEGAWAQLAARDPQAQFFYGVVSTGIFCRPACASRLPLRSNVRFFASAAEAEAAGFRPCKRCRPADGGFLDKSRAATDRVRRHIEKNLDRRVRLEDLARVARMSQFTVQRLFKRAMGVSPLQYQRALRASRLRDALKQESTVICAIYSAGFSSSSRAYEGAQLGMTPARFAQGGKGEVIGFTSAKTPFGWMAVGATVRGLCWLALARTRGEAEATLRAEFPQAILQRDPSMEEIVQVALDEVYKTGDGRPARTPLDLCGTAFQLRVWQALRKIPRGETRSYSQLAVELGDPKATRAVARACATNRVAILVPCHRVVGADGSLTGYRWGVERKRQLLKAERENRIQVKSYKGAKANAMQILHFNTSADFRDWLEKNHTESEGIWLRIFKKDSRKKSLTYTEALDEALCYGWIDGQKKPYDEMSWLQKFTPRRPKSAWSKINTQRGERLIEKGTMTPAGMKAIAAAKADGRWESAYPSPRSAAPPEYFLRELSKNEKAEAFFRTLNKANVFSIVYRLETAKKPETREKRMKTILAMMEQGKAFHP